MFNKIMNTAEINEYSKTLEVERNALEKMAFRKTMPNNIIENQVRVVDVMQKLLVTMVEKAGK